MSYQVSCSQDDDFQVKSNDEQEVISMTKEHAREKHDMDMDDDQVREMIQEH
jgi:predicted small metal-binding protein